MGRILITDELIKAVSELIDYDDYLCGETIGEILVSSRFTADNTDQTGVSICAMFNLFTGFYRIYDDEGRTGGNYLVTNEDKLMALKKVIDMCL